MTTNPRSEHITPSFSRSWYEKDSLGFFCFFDYWRGIDTKNVRWASKWPKVFISRQKK